MTRYSVQPRDRTFIKIYEFLSFAKNTGKNISKNISKSLKGKYSQKLLDHAEKSQMYVKLLPKESFKKKQNQVVIWLVIKLLIILQKFQEIYNKIT